MNLHAGTVSRVLMLAAGLLARAATAEVYSISWFKVAGGGGASTDGVYTISGTLGQPEAGAPLTAGTYAVTGGVQFESAGSDIPPVPLRIVSVTQRLIGGASEVHITVAGTPGRVFQLQATSDLAPAIAWADLGAQVSAPTQGLIDFIDPSPPGLRFYRVIEP